MTMSNFRVPSATYRTQLHLGFRFANARDLVPYLYDLGISDLYASPRFKARRGSSHGYDVANPLRVNSELGTEEEFDELSARLARYGMGLVLDIVPNHMSASAENPWWMDVLENGPGSQYADYFDIDWHPCTPKAALLQENKVMLPVLGDVYGRVLGNQELVLKLDEGGFYIRYYDARFPVDPQSYTMVLDRCAPGNGIAELAAAAAALPVYTDASPESVARRRREKERIRQELWQLYLTAPGVRTTVDEVLRSFNGEAGNPRSFDLLDALLARQPYRLAYWKMGIEEINYRRFFDINDLVGLRVDRPAVFAARHEQILQLIAEGKITGLRIDHIDGLFDPGGYLARLREAAARSPDGRFYVVVEKILGSGERLPDWPVCGTTGYDFLNAVNGLFVPPQGLEAMEKVYREFTGDQTAFSDLWRRAKRCVVEQLFSGDLRALKYHLGRLAADDREARDLPIYELGAALLQTTACLPVYRTYIRDQHVSDADRAVIEGAVAEARRVANGNAPHMALDFLRRVLLLETPYYAEDSKPEWLRFVMRWQQFTGPVMAKGLEDTANYVHNSLVSLNEVGADGDRRSRSLEEFHRFNLCRGKRWPHSLNATSTHDTKRSEDVRARIDVLAEMPGSWANALARWAEWNRGAKRTVEGHSAPSAADEILLYQTLLGTWPLDGSSPEYVRRVKCFAIKAAREAKCNTSWHLPGEPYEAALTGFIDSILQDSASPFMSDFLRLEGCVAWYGAWNALSQLVLKTACPGVPDFYQGTELWDFSLVDPDNRRPVDFRSRQVLLDGIKRAQTECPRRLVADILANWKDGRVKMFTTWAVLNARRAAPELFLDGDYLPLAPAGIRGEHVCAFARRLGGEWVVAAVPRWLAGVAAPGTLPLGGTWGDTEIALPGDAPRQWTNLFTGENLCGGGPALPAGDLFRDFPVALLRGSAAEMQEI